METIKFKVYPHDKEQIDTIKKVFKALKIKFVIEQEKTYDPKFVKRVLEAKKEIKQGRGTKIDTNDLWK